MFFQVYFLKGALNYIFCTIKKQILYYCTTTFLKQNSFIKKSLTCNFARKTSEIEIFLNRLPFLDVSYRIRVKPVLSNATIRPDFEHM